MTDRDAFLRAIRADPDADTPRLVYADWLDENGQPEAAEFIRVQVELEPVRHRLDDPHVRALIRRADELDRSAYDRPSIDDPSLYWRARFRRGLADSAQVDVQTLLTHGPDLREEYPTVRELAVFDFEGQARCMAECPALADLAVIELACPLDTNDITGLMACPHLRGVETLRLWIGWSDGLAERIAVGSNPPARIELVQLLGGAVVGGDRADELYAEADALARRVNAVAGRELAHVVRPSDRLFPLCGWGDDGPDIAVGGGMFAGRLPDGTPALVGPTDYEMAYAVARFHPDGRLAAGETVHSFGAVPVYRAGWDDIRRWLTGTLGLTPALIRVREFTRDREFGVTLWSDQEYVADEGGWQSSETELYEWLRDGNFYIGEHPADWRGRTRAT